MWDDHEVDEVVAETLWVLPEPSGATWPLDEIDKYCGAAGAALRGLVSFTYCWFRSPEEHTDCRDGAVWTSMAVSVER